MSLEYVGTAGVVYMVLFTLVVPLVVLRSAHRMRTHPLPPAVAVFRSVLVQQAVIIAVSLLAARAEWIPLYLVPDRWGLALALAVGLTIGLVLVMRPMWRRAVTRRDARIQLLTPRTPGERVLWCAVSVAAGVAEEVVYRGVLWVRTPLRFFPIKQLVLYVLPFPRSAPTAQALRADALGDVRSVVEERMGLDAALASFLRMDRHARWRPHPAFGTMNGPAWGYLLYKHADHHLSQFGA